MNKAFNFLFAFALIASLILSPNLAFAEDDQGKGDKTEEHAGDKSDDKGKSGKGKRPEDTSDEEDDTDTEDPEPRADQLKSSIDELVKIIKKHHDEAEPKFQPGDVHKHAEALYVAASKLVTEKLSIEDIKKKLFDEKEGALTKAFDKNLDLVKALSFYFDIREAKILGTKEIPFSELERLASSEAKDDDDLHKKMAARWEWERRSIELMQFGDALTLDPNNRIRLQYAAAVLAMDDKHPEYDRLKGKKEKAADRIDEEIRRHGLDGLKERLSAMTPKKWAADKGFLERSGEELLALKETLTKGFEKDTEMGKALAEARDRYRETLSENRSSRDVFEAGWEYKDGKLVKKEGKDAEKAREEFVRRFGEDITVGGFALAHRDTMEKLAGSKDKVSLGEAYKDAMASMSDDGKVALTKVDKPWSKDGENVKVAAAELTKERPAREFFDRKNGYGNHRFDADAYFGDGWVIKSQGDKSGEDTPEKPEKTSDIEEPELKGPEGDKEGDKTPLEHLQKMFNFDSPEEEEKFYSGIDRWTMGMGGKALRKIIEDAKKHQVKTDAGKEESEKKDDKPLEHPVKMPTDAERLGFSWYDQPEDGSRPGLNIPWGHVDSWVADLADGTKGKFTDFKSEKFGDLTKFTLTSDLGEKLVVKVNEKERRVKAQGWGPEGTLDFEKTGTLYPGELSLQLRRLAYGREKGAAGSVSMNGDFLNYKDRNGKSFNYDLPLPDGVRASVVNNRFLVLESEDGSRVFPRTGMLGGNFSSAAIDLLNIENIGKKDTEIKYHAFVPPSEDPTYNYENSILEGNSLNEMIQPLLTNIRYEQAKASPNSTTSDGFTMYSSTSINNSDEPRLGPSVGNIFIKESNISGQDPYVIPGKSWLNGASVDSILKDTVYIKEGGKLWRLKLDHGKKTYEASDATDDILDI